MNDRETLTHTAEGGAYEATSRRTCRSRWTTTRRSGSCSRQTSLGPVAEGSAQSYTVKLSSEPTATTTVGITGHENAPVSLSGLSASSTLTFTASTSWNSPQTVTVTATQDPDAVDDEITLTHTANGGDYQDVTEKLDRHGGPTTR